MLKLISRTNPKDFILVQKQLSDEERKKLVSEIVKLSEKRLLESLNKKDYDSVSARARSLDHLASDISCVLNGIYNGWENKAIETILWEYFMDWVVYTYLDTNAWDNIKNEILNS
jgi:hypothetical protein